MRSILSRVFTLCAVTVPVVASAQAEPAGAARSKARTIVAAGEEAFAARRYDAALAAFEQAYLLDPVPVLLYNIGRAHEELKHYDEAARFFQSYLDRVPGASDRAQVEQRLKLLRSAAAAQAEAQKAKAEAEKARAEAEKARAEAQKPPPDAPPDRVTGETTVQGNEALTWGLVGGGTALIVTGVVFLTLASGNANEAADLEPTRAGLDRYRELEDQTSTFEVVGWLGLGFGAAAAGAGLALLFLDGGPTDAAVRIAPAPGGLVLGGHF